MTTRILPDPDLDLYPDSDGQPMAENTLQFQWIVTLQGNLDRMYENDPDVFVAGDLLWYAEKGKPAERAAPDAMVIFGRPKGYRGSYKQWVEDDIAPQVVFEVLSPGNRRDEMDRKFAFYEKHGVEEYYIYDPDQVDLEGWQRIDDQLSPVDSIDGYVSPRLGIRFDMSGEELVILRPDKSRFLTFLELGKLAEQKQQEAEDAKREAETARKETDTARKEAETARKETDTARKEAARLADRLRELGIDPDA
jgi:Uma2 family endonuclease